MAKILATVGTAEWDEMIEALDAQVADGLINDTIVAQIGRGVYEPKHLRFYRMASPETHQKGIDWADIVISTGGSATIKDCIMRRKKKMILVWMRPWSPQAFKPFIDGKHVLYCHRLEDLHLYIQEAKTFAFQPFESEPFALQPIVDLIGSESGQMHPAEKRCGALAICCIVVFIIIMLIRMLWY